LKFEVSLDPDLLAHLIVPEFIHRKQGVWILTGGQHLA
jgi:hypothetical protein